jgi:lipid-A-disaccharide synthase-like uncharacterized protein
MHHWIDFSQFLAAQGFMGRPFFETEIFGKPFVLVPWKIVGYFGVLMFGLRWLPQMIATRRAKQVRMPRIFWVMSVTGSIALLAYFTFGKNDSVGVLSNLLPAFVATFNLITDLRHGRRREEGTP